MSDARIQELESEIGGLENESLMLMSDNEIAQDAIMSNRARIRDIGDEIVKLNDEINHEPFDEPI